LLATLLLELSGRIPDFPSRCHFAVKSVFQKQKRMEMSTVSALITHGGKPESIIAPEKSRAVFLQQALPFFGYDVNHNDSC
jgi:hypothetical protein